MKFSQKTTLQKSPTTALSEAFAKASASPVEGRLNEIALVAMVAHADDTTKAIERVWSEVRKDCDLLIQLFDRYGQHRTEIGRVFHQLKIDISSQSSRGAELGPRERKVMKILKQERDEERKEKEEQRRLDREEQARRDQEYKEYLASWHKTPLFGLTIGDKPVWENSAGTIRAWLPTQRKKLRALEMLIEGVPDDGRPLEYYRTPEDVKEVWKILGGEV